MSKAHFSKHLNYIDRLLGSAVNYGTFQLIGKSRKQDVTASCCSLQIPAANSSRSDDGFKFPDGSLFSLEYVVKALPIPEALSDFESVLTVDDADGPFGYVAKYSFTFVPKSQKAKKEIGFVRYNFHPEMLGETWQAQHPLFHLHTNPLDELPRLATGFVDLQSIISNLEAILSPDARHVRLVDILGKETSGAYKLLLSELGDKAFADLVAGVFSSTREVNKVRSLSRFLKLNSIEVGWS